VKRVKREKRAHESIEVGRELKRDSVTNRYKERHKTNSLHTLSIFFSPQVSGTCMACQDAFLCGESLAVAMIS
jgi:hypothetical protein